MKRIYYAVAHDEGGKFWCEFPDIGNTVADADTLDELFPRAADVAQTMIDYLFDEGNAIPKPTPAAEVAKKFPGEVIFAVETYEPQKTERINLSCPGHYVSMITAAAKKRKMTRSEFMIRASVEYAAAPHPASR